MLRREGDAAAQYGLGFRSVDLAASVRHPITGENVPLEGVAQDKHIDGGRCATGWPAAPRLTRQITSSFPAVLVASNALQVCRRRGLARRPPAVCRRAVLAQ